MANPPPSFSSFPDFPVFAAPPPPPPARSSSSRHGASSTRRSRSPEGARKSKSRDKDDAYRRDGDSKHRSRKHEKEDRDERDRRRGEPSSSLGRRRRSRSRSPHRDRPSGSSSSSRRDKEPSRATTQSSAAPVPSTSAGMPVVNELYYAAGRGDEANVAFGSLHKYSLAKFHRAGAGSVVGLPQGFKIARDPNASGSSAVLVEWRERKGSKAMRYSDKLARGLLNAPSLVIQPAAQSATTSSLGDYVRFSKRRRIEESVEESYRAIDAASGSSSSEEEDEAESGAALPEGVFGRLPGIDHDEVDDEGKDEAGSGVETKESAYKARNLRFAQQAKEAPLDVANWLAWAHFSAHAGFDVRPLASGSSFSSSAPPGPSSKSRASITFTVLDRAALSNPSLESDPAFVLALLEAAAEAEDSLALAARWDRVLSGPLNKDVNIWRAWGTWQMLSRSGQQAEGDDLTRWAEDGLERLRTMWRDAPHGSTDREDLEGVEIYLLLRACVALREAGYVERAIAILQAQMEITFYLPPTISRWPWAEQVSSLETFWEAEAPRFGETGARGWCHSAGVGSNPPAPSQPPPAPPAVDEPFTLWLAAETVADEAVLSARTDDEARQVAEGQTDEDDPFKLVLWPDVEGFLLPLSSESSRMQLVFALFSFLDLPFAPPEVSTSTPFFSDAFLLNTLAHSPLGRLAFFPEHLRSPGTVPRKLISDGGMEPEQEGGIPSPHECPIKATPVTAEALVPASVTGPHLLARHSVDDRFRPLICNVLEQLRRLFHWDPTYSLYAISFEASQNTKGAIKLAKGILSENRDSLVLWNAYARLERQRGKLAEGRKVYHTALSLSSSEVRRQSALGDGDVWTLFRGWAELEQSESRPAHAVAIVTVAASGHFDRLDSLLRPEAPTLSPLQALQTRQALGETIARTLDPASRPSTTRNSTNLIYLSALFEYDVAGLQAACDVYDRHLDASSSIPAAEKEELHLQYADLLFRHVTTPRSTFQPGRVRAVLERGIAAFPSNTALLSYYAATESRMRYQNKVRKVLDEVVLAPATGAKGPNGFLFAVWAELRAVKGRHNEWAVRSLFERAFDRPDANMSLSLWRLAIDHEILLGQPKRAKRLLYRAIKACPWSKDLYLLPFGPLRTVYMAKELEELSDLMAERRIRVRVSLDGFVAGWDEAGSSAGEAEDPMREEASSGLDERRLISEQEERKRLMPY